MWSNRFAPIANPYTTPGKSLKPNGQVTVEKVIRGAAAAAEDEAKRMAVEEAWTGEEDEVEEETRVARMREEEDTVSPLGRNKGRQQEAWKTVGRKEKEDATKEAANRANIVGIKMVRIGKSGNTGWCPGDVSYFFEMLRRIDPSAIVMNARRENSSAMTVKEVETMSALDYKGYLDMRNDAWGKPTENKMKTAWMCHVATDLLTPQLQQLRDDRKVQEYLKQGDITMQFTKLHESNSKVAFHFANKDPKYTNRIDLEERVQKHVNRFSNKVIPIHVLNMGVSGKNFGTRMCTAVVGGKDIRKVESILKEHPFTELEIIPFSWKFQDNEGYTRRLKEHEGVLKLCKAIKMEEMNVSDEMEEFKTLMAADQNYQYVIDIFPAIHAQRTGIIYVQYISEHKSSVLLMINDVVRTIKEAREANETILQFPDGPKIVNNNGSVSPTIQTTTQSVRTTTTNKTRLTIPSSKYGGLLNQDLAAAVKPSQVPFAISIHTKSFREAIIGRASSPDNYDNKTDTLKSGITSGQKSSREVELEGENQRLKNQLQEKEEHYQLIMKQVQESFDRQRLRDREYHDQKTNNLQQQILQLESALNNMIQRVSAKQDENDKFEGSNNKDDLGSTPKRPRKRSVSTTPMRADLDPDPDSMQDTLPDEETITLKEGLKLD
jgi:hypothetical protein